MSLSVKRSLFAILATATATAITLVGGAAKAGPAAAAKPQRNVASSNEGAGGDKEPKKAKKSLHQKYSGTGYGLAGCGLGSIIFGAQPGKVQILAATTNGTFYNQSFGLTFGTANCDIPQMGQQAAVFIEVNKEVVKKEAARGEGESLQGLSALLNCHDQSLFDQKVHENYEQIFADGQSTYGSVREILKTIKADQKLSSTCDLEA